MVDRKAPHISPQRYAQKVALSESCRLFRLKQEWLAMLMHKDQATISRWLDPERPDFPTFDEWTEFVGIIKDHTGCIEPLRSLCQWHGADAVSLSPRGVGLDAKTLGRLASLIARKEGAVLGLLIQILEDGKIDEEEEAGLSEAVEDIETLHAAVGDLCERARAARNQQQKRRRA